MTGTSNSYPESFENCLRIDKWLWHSHFFKSRSAAARFVASGKVRVNRRAVTKTAYALRHGDVLTFMWRDGVAVIQVQSLGKRRGPPAEARSLYHDLSDLPLTPQLAQPSPPMLDRAYGQSDISSVHAATR